MMTVLFSRKCEYALQGILYLAKSAPGTSVSAQQIAEDLGISKEFISKTLQQLVQEGIVRSSRGKHGGFSLINAAEQIALLDIVQIIDGNDIFDSCLLGLPECGSGNPCPVHAQWGEIRERTRQMLATTSVSEF